MPEGYRVRMDPSSDERVVRFFESYVSDFESFDASAIANHFAYPCHITSDMEQPQLSSSPSHEHWKGQIEGLVALYQQLGVATASILEMTESALSPRVTQARVHWMLKTSTGEEVYDFTGVYTLVDEGGGLKISAIAHDELPKLMARLAGGAEG